MEMLKSAAGLYIVHIPYNGNGPAGTAVIAGQVEALFGSMPAVLPHAKSDRVRALAVGTPKRSPSLPDVPTVAESGFPGFDASLWLGIMAPAGTSAAILERLHKDIVAVVDSPDPSSTLCGRFLERPRAVIGFAGSDLQNVVSRSALNSLTASVL
jgi:tripartite-type tricarboxylate transporter receptor subunit TctC